MSTIVELESDTTATGGSTIEELLAGGSEVVEIAGETTENVIDSLLTQGNSLGDAALAGGAFAYALADGWSFGLLSAVMDAVGLGDEVDSLQEAHPNLTTAGDVASYISPAIAVKLWTGAGKLAGKGIARIIANGGFNRAAKSQRKIMDAFDDFVKKNKGGRPVGTGVNKIFKDAFGWNDLQVDKFLKKNKIDGKFLNSAIMTMGYGSITMATKVSPQLMKMMKAESAFANQIARLEKLGKALNIGALDIFEIAMSYSAAYNYYKSRGASDEEARKAGYSYAIAHLMGKGVTTQVIDRVMTRFRKDNLGLTGKAIRWLGERAGGLAIYNFGDAEAAIGDAVSTAQEAAGNALIHTGEALAKRSGGLVVY